ncbi:hypothetical protein MKX01_023103 [Papaver californicum]|nr:hypothetical protein MKX01_023103 [Papaver californicum]
MSFKSILQEMKGEFGSMSRKGFDLGYGFRSRSHRVVHEDLGLLRGVDALKQSCWANMPPELLRDVLMRIEEADSMWPSRKNVVVCRSWREPGPKDTVIQCFITRNRSTQAYHLYLSLTQDYVISIDADDMSKGSGTYIGKLRSNFLGTKFTVYDSQPPHGGATITRSRSTRLVGLKQVSPKVPAGNYPVAHIAYELNVLGSRGPRRMQCVLDAIPGYADGAGGLAPEQTELPSSNQDSFPSLPFFRTLVLRNKAPRWHEQLQCWCLNFLGQVTVASVKNFQLVASPEGGPAGPEHDKVLLQFGKVGKDLFTMDFQHPISAFQAFAICLSSFDTKIACE